MVARGTRDGDVLQSARKLIAKRGSDAIKTILSPKKQKVGEKDE